MVPVVAMLCSLTFYFGEALVVFDGVILREGRVAIFVRSRWVGGCVHACIRHAHASAFMWWGA